MWRSSSWLWVAGIWCLDQLCGVVGCGDQAPIPISCHKVLRQAFLLFINKLFVSHPKKKECVKNCSARFVVAFPSFLEFTIVAGVPLFFNSSTRVISTPLFEPLFGRFQSFQTFLHTGAAP